MADAKTDEELNSDILTDDAEPYWVHRVLVALFPTQRDMAYMDAITMSRDCGCCATFQLQRPAGWRMVKLSFCVKHGRNIPPEP